jgi:signal transduction histidine kinase
MKQTTKVFFNLSCHILELANKEKSKIAFLEKILKILTEFSRCDSIGFWLKDGKKYHYSRSFKDGKPLLNFEVIGTPQNQNQTDLIRLLIQRIDGQFDTSSAFCTKQGALLINNLGEFLSSCPDEVVSIPKDVLEADAGYFSTAILPIRIEEAYGGFLQLRSKRPNHFKRSEADYYEALHQIIGIAFMNWHIRVALNERIKELSCLYSILQLSDQPDRSMDEILQGAVELLPPAWQFPDIATARITFDGSTFSLPGFQRIKRKQSSDIVVKGNRSGTVEVAYTEEKPELDEGPFLTRKLIESVARELSLTIERRLHEEEKEKLLDQLRHADRLAIIGQLAASVAHELNEPLANILGFAQLAMKSEGLQKQTQEDIEKILASSLHSREIIKKLLSFARQTPSKQIKVSLNRVIQETLYFFDSRCGKEGIDLELSLSPDLRDITGDASQLMQVITNLVVNAMQAMPKGGKLIIRTFQSGDHVYLEVEDTGIGMSELVKSKIFTPFFTNKRAGLGTGLGLPVVHGIVLAHGGTIRVESQAGHGTKFEIRFPVTSLMGIGKDENRNTFD